ARLRGPPRGHSRFRSGGASHQSEAGHAYSDRSRHPRAPAKTDLTPSLLIEIYRRQMFPEEYKRTIGEWRSALHNRRWHEEIPCYATSRTFAAMLSARLMASSATWTISTSTTRPGPSATWSSKPGDGVGIARCSSRRSQ